MLAWPLTYFVEGYSFSSVNYRLMIPVKVRPLAEPRRRADVRLACCCIALNDSVQVKTSLFKSRYHLVTYFKAVQTDAGAHGYLDALGRCTMSVHLVNYRLDNAASSSSPAGMSDSNDTRFAVGKDNGHTVGCIHPNDHTRQRGHQRVNTFQGTFLLVDIQRTESLVNHSHTA